AQTCVNRSPATALPPATLRDPANRVPLLDPPLFFGTLARVSETLTPMMQQYQGIRRSLPADTLLLFRLGDFYEMFFEDAKEASSSLNVALNKRNQVPMCGIPYHAADNYVRKLIGAGRRVAICDQVSEPQPGKIVQREITHIVSPGTISDLQMLDAKRNNF